MITLRYLFRMIALGKDREKCIYTCLMVDDIYGIQSTGMKLVHVERSIINVYDNKVM